MKIFALNGSREYGAEVTDALGMRLSNHDEKYFPDREVYCCSAENVRGSDVYVISSLYSDKEESVNTKLMKLLIFIGSLRDASAGRITAVLPYLCFARQDRKTNSRAPITTKYVAQILQSVGTDRLLTIDAHNPTAIQNAFSINVDLLEANGLFASYFADQIMGRKFREIILDKPSVLVGMSPDTGGMNRLRRFRNFLEHKVGKGVGIACLDKIHTDDEIRGNDIIGKVGGKAVIIVDDMISSGKTILECIEACKRRGASCIVAACATHGLFVGNANEYLDSGFLHNIVVTDTIDPFRLTNERIRKKVVVLKTAPLFAEAIKRTNKDESISSLIANNGFQVVSRQLAA